MPRRVIRHEKRIALLAFGVAFAAVACRSSPGVVIGFTRVRAGHEFSFGEVVLPSMPVTAVIESVELVDPSPGLIVRDRMIVLTSRSIYAASNSFPPPGPVGHPLPFEVPAHREADVMLGLVVNAPGHYAASGVDVAYHVGANHYVVRYPIGVTAVTPGQ